ncbi:MAG: TldD/PmbA family protein [Bacteroidales bacterium]|nr:TldD/PmbA family protein [Bacteroidales bacterium]
MLKDKGMITAAEIAAARSCMALASGFGASASRVSLGKSIMDSYSLRDSAVDKVSHNSDCSIYLTVFVDGRSGNFSTNRLDSDELSDFVKKAVATTRLLAPDTCRHLQDPALTAKNVSEGDELNLYDRSWHYLEPGIRLEKAFAPAVKFREIVPAAGEWHDCACAQAEKSGGSVRTGLKWRLISEESEWSDGLDDNYLIDSNGFEGRHIETSFSYCSEVTIEDSEGNKYSGYWWECAPKLAELDYEGCSLAALQNAVGQIGPARTRGGYRTMVLDSRVASRLVSPIIGSLSAMSVQQKNSFLEGKLGEKVFSDHFTFIDKPIIPGKSGSRLFDTEGTATKERTLIERGVVKTYFVSSYAASKTGLAPTVEGVSVPVIEPFCTKGPLVPDASGMIRRFRNGIYVTGLNGGNCNNVTGDFSYGVSGFVFRNGKILAPFKEGLITGNMIELWNNIAAAGTDARTATRWQIPSLVFTDVSFSV